MKIDLKRERKDLYQPPATPALVDVPAMRYLMVDGTGDPNTSAAYREAVEALFPLAYALKFMLKRGPLATDYVVMPLEGLWWMPGDLPYQRGSDDQQWIAMIRQPDDVTMEMVDNARDFVARKKNLHGLNRLRFDELSEGTSAQVMHTGPYADEGPTIERLHAFIEQQSMLPNGRHHEIYLSDPNRTAPEKLKTILRQPCRPA